MQKEVTHMKPHLDVNHEVVDTSIIDSITTEDVSVEMVPTETIGETVDDTCPFEVFEPMKEEVKSPRYMKKDEKFKFYAEKRVNSILMELNALGDLAFTYSGTYDQEMVKAIFYTIHKATDATRELYRRKERVMPCFSFG